MLAACGSTTGPRILAPLMASSPHDTTAPRRASRADRTTAAVAAATIVVTGSALGLWLRADSGRPGSPFPALQQLDLLYLDEPAPAYDALGFSPGEPGLLLVCPDACPAPAVDAQVRRSGDPAVARAYGLLTSDGRVGPGYALIDGEGHVRYRTFDAQAAAHGEEIAVLLGGLR